MEVGLCLQRLTNKTMVYNYIYIYIINMIDILFPAWAPS